MDAASKTYLSLAEYNQLEEETNTRYEYHDGEVFAMAGGDPKHGVIAGNTLTLLNNALFSKSCTVFNSDVKTHIASIKKSYYPDVSVVCGPVERSEQDARAIANPILLIEVLSESTAAFDRVGKFEDYSQLPSLREYVLIEQDRPLLQTFYREAPGALWQMQWFSAEGNTKVVLPSIDVSISLTDIYHKTEGL